MNNDVVVGFYSKGNILLGYFYKGEYHLWGSKEKRNSALVNLV